MSPGERLRNIKNYLPILCFSTLIDVTGFSQKLNMRVLPKIKNVYMHVYILL